MNFLFVLEPREQNDEGWGDILANSVEKWAKANKITARTHCVTSVDEAEALLQDRDTHVDQVITGSFGSSGEYLNAPWRNVQAAARDARGLNVTLLTSVGFGINENDVVKLRERGIAVVDKLNFREQMENFLTEQLSGGGQREIIK